MSLVRLRYLATVNPPTPEFDRRAPEQVTFLPLEAVWADNRLDISRTRPKAEVATGYVRFREGDVLCPKVTPTFQAGRSALMESVASGVGAASTEVHVVRAKPGVSDARFVRYALLSKAFLDEGVARFQGVAGLQRVPEDHLKDFRVLDAEISEQRRIADFLDDQVTRIDQAIHLRKQQATLVKAGNSARLDQLLCSSFVRTSRLAQLTDPRRPVQYGIVLPGPDFEGGVPIVKGGDVAAHRMSPEELNRTDPEIDARYPRSRLVAGDLLIAIRGSVGELATVPKSLEGANITQDAARIAHHGCDPLWLRWVLQTPTVQGRIRKEVTGATVTGINIGSLRRILIPTPDLSEQRRLGAVADLLSQRSARLVHDLSQSVTLLRERKWSLIAAAVTGEFDVSSASSRAAGVASSGV